MTLPFGMDCGGNTKLFLWVIIETISFKHILINNTEFKFVTSYSWQHCFEYNLISKNHLLIVLASSIKTFPYDGDSVMSYIETFQIMQITWSFESIDVPAIDQQLVADDNRSWRLFSLFKLSFKRRKLDII